MSWMIWISGAVLLTSLEGVLNRFLLADRNWHWPYLFGYSAGALTVLAMIAAKNGIHDVAHLDPRSILLLLVSGTCWFLSALYNFKADQLAAVSETSLFSQLQLVVVFLGGLLFFHEDITFAKISGITLICLGLSYLAGRPHARLQPGLVYKIFAATMAASAILIDKYLLDSMALNAETVSISGFAVPLLLTAALRPKTIREGVHLIRELRGSNIILGAFGCLAYFSLMKAISSTPVSLAYPIYMSHLIVTFLIGYFYLRERDFLARKAVSAAAIFIGAVLIHVVS